MKPIPVIEKEAKLKLKNCPSVPTKGEAKPPPDQEINLQIPKKGPVDSSGAKSLFGLKTITAEARSITDNLSLFSISDRNTTSAALPIPAVIPRRTSSLASKLTTMLDLTMSNLYQFLSKQSNNVKAKQRFLHADAMIRQTNLDQENES